MKLAKSTTSKVVTKPTPRQRAVQQRTLKTRAAIINAAIEEFSDYGFEGATTRRIAEQAGVPNSLLHYHFPSKDELWRACADELYGEFGTELRRIRAAKPPGVAQLRAVFNLCLRAFVKNSSLARFGMHDNESNIARRRYVFQVHLPSFQESLAESVKIAQAEGVFPEGDAALIASFIMGAIWNLGVRKVDTEFFLGRPVNTEMIDEVGSLIDRMLFTRQAPQSAEAEPVSDERARRPSRAKAASGR